MTMTIWGKSLKQLVITRGVTFHTTARHGGFLVSKGYAEKHLSGAALKVGELTGNYYAFEEDCAADVIYLELPESRKRLITKTDELTLITSLSKYFPDYLRERGLNLDNQSISAVN